MIVSFRDKTTEKVFHGEFVKKYSRDIRRIAQRKLVILHATDELPDLKVPPGNQLEKLKWDRIGQHSIRINDQWRICFKWEKGNAHDVEIADYHD